MSTKIDFFRKELALIRDSEYREFAVSVLQYVPVAFFVKPASSSAKYHNKLSRGKCGLVYHTRMAMWIAENRFVTGSNFDRFTAEEMDIILVSLMFHDSAKYGVEGDSDHTLFEHPVLVKQIFDKYLSGEGVSERVRKFAAKVIECIETHHGKWNKGYKGEADLPLPAMQMQYFVHDCDYLSSFSFLNFDVSVLDGMLLERGLSSYEDPKTPEEVDASWQPVVDYVAEGGLSS